MCALYTCSRPRFGRLQPSYFSKGLIGAIASLDKVCKYIDIRLLHLNSSVLQRMAWLGGMGKVILLRQRDVRGGRAALELIRTRRRSESRRGAARAAVVLNSALVALHTSVRVCDA